MSLMKSRKPVTIEDMYNMPKDGRKYELVNGEILVSPGNWRHTEIATKIAHIFATFLDASPVGKVFCDNLGVVLPNRNLRSPDVTLVRAEKLPDGKLPQAFADVVPDLAVEVLSPSNGPGYIATKIGEFLECGVTMVWVVDPERETVTVYRSLSQTEQYSADDTITAEPLLPGFSCLVSRLF
jgi:Uma2 family endonuclease